MKPPTDAATGPERAVETIQFSYEGVAYSIDLDPDDAAAFEVALAPYIEAGRRVGGRR